MQKIKTKRVLVLFIGCGLLLAASAFVGTTAAASSEASADASTGETIVVSSSDSIQDAIDRADPGDTIEVRPGTYQEALTVDKAVTLRAPDGATLDGVGLDGGIAITVTASNVHIEGFEIVRYDERGVYTPTRIDDITISDVEVTDNPGLGISLEAETATIENVTSSDNGDTGLAIESSATGEVSIINSEFERNDDSGSIYRDGRGIDVTGAEQVTIENVVAAQNEDAAILVDGGNALGQTIEISEVEITSSSATGLRVSGTDGDDTVTVSASHATNNAGHGISLEAETATIENVTASDNGDSGLAIESSATGEVSITDSEFERNDDSGSIYRDGRGIDVTGAEQVTIENVVAVQNDGSGLRIEGDDVRGQSVEISEVEITSSSATGLRVSGTDGDDTVTVSASDVTNNAGHGILLEAEATTIENATASDNDGSGLAIESSATGEVSIIDSEFERNAGERGIGITGAERVTIENVHATRNAGTGLRIEAGDVRGQSVEIRNVTVIESRSGNGIYVPGSGGTDDVTVVASESNDNDDYGFYLGGESVVIEDTVAEGNGEGSLHLSEIDREEATIRNSFPEPVFEVTALDLPSEALPGEEVTMEATVQNTGDADGTASVRYQSEGAVRDLIEDVTLEQGASESVSYTFVAPESPGDYEHGVVAGDDERTATLSVREPAHFDVTIESVPETVTAGDTVDVEYTVENTGGIEGTQDVTFAVNDAEKATPSKTLEGGDTASGTFTYRTQPGDEPTIDIVVASEDDTNVLSVSVLEAEAGDDGTETETARDPLDEGDETEQTTEEDDGESREATSEERTTYEDETSEDDDGLSGFGLAVAAVAIVSAALLALRRRR